jgi:NAD(P)-dependent dehydrogenase (short-subunit alcohol dehydrogenase family)
VFAVNVLGVVNTSREFARRLQQEGRPGAIVNVTSVSALYLSDPTTTAYSASKSAANTVTRIAARAFGGLGIRVNAVAPGVMDNRMRVSGADTGPAQNTRHDSAERLRRINEATPLEGRRVTAHDIAQGVVSLLGADFVTGQVLAVDGGLSLRTLG